MPLLFFQPLLAPEQAWNSPKRPFCIFFYPGFGIVHVSGVSLSFAYCATAGIRSQNGLLQTFHLDRFFLKPTKTHRLASENCLELSIKKHQLLAVVKHRQECRAPGAWRSLPSNSRFGEGTMQLSRVINGLYQPENLERTEIHGALKHRSVLTFKKSRDVNSTYLLRLDPAAANRGEAKSLGTEGDDLRSAAGSSAFLPSSRTAGPATLRFCTNCKTCVGEGVKSNS